MKSTLVCATFIELVARTPHVKRTLHAHRSTISITWKLVGPWHQRWHQLQRQRQRQRCFVQSPVKVDARNGGLNCWRKIETSITADSPMVSRFAEPNVLPSLNAGVSRSVGMKSTLVCATCTRLAARTPYVKRTLHVHRLTTSTPWTPVGPWHQR